MKSSVSAKGITKSGFSIPALSLMVVAVIALLVGGAFGALDLTISGVVIAALIMAVIIFFRQDELAAIIVIAVHLYIDWYLGMAFVAQFLTLFLLLIFLLARSSRYPWVAPRALWLWILLLVLAIIPALHGITLPDGGYYYLNVVFNAFIVFWLGIVVGRDIVSIRRFFRIFSFFGVLVAVHVIIQSTTGAFLLASSRYDTYLSTVSNFELTTGSGAFRAGSFFVNPDSSGAFFCTMLLIPLGLFFDNSSFLGKAFYSAELFLISLGLLFTYSTAGWIGAMVGVMVFIVLVGRMRYRVLILGLLFGAAIMVVLLFPTQVALLLQHANSPKELVLRSGAWQTGLRVIQAFPLTGVGLGRYVYVQRAEPFRVPAQYIPLYHPHNSYLELAALGGVPLLIVFIALLSFALWLALRNWLQADMQIRALLGGGIAAVIALSFNSLANPGWTLAPLTALGWLLLGAISSPLLTTSKKNDVIQEKGSSV